MRQYDLKFSAFQQGVTWIGQDCAHRWAGGRSGEEKERQVDGNCQ